ncbi:FHA domain-containing protein [Arthrobacter sp. zg-Y769]|uniref:FHA domain-containing protein n=1 Tax=Arthrobacter sp. zg-Y769 TaxID=2894191 RepID=UPI001E5B1E99|nr:FHA domain-containing protein [Arthrobacter sp. zg-Y769]MCC9205486.1 FHA domain-containing protein [Arthrobacter sp. zg-Y769]
MDGLRYRPGTWICLVHDSVLCLLPPDTGEERVREIWSLLGTAPALDRVFTAVSGGLSGSLADMPFFGVLSLGDRMHVLLRGPLELQQAGKDEPAASGEFVTTWSERVLPAGGSYCLTVTASGAAAVSSTDSLRLPLERGVVLVSELEFGPVEDGGRTAPARQMESRPAPAALPTQSLPAAAPLPAPVLPTQPRPAEPEPAPVLPAAPEDTPAAPAEPDTESQDTVKPGEHPVSAQAQAQEPDLSETVRPLEESLVPTLQPVEAAVPPAPPAAAAPNALIDSVPWLRGNEAAPVEATRVQPVPAPARVPAPAPAPAPAAPAPAVAPDQAQEDLDHDGDTIMSSDLPRTEPVPAADSRSNTAPTVLARICAGGHANPPTRSVCAQCGGPLGEEPQPVHRPPLGRVVFSTGQVETLDRNIVVGRQPSVARTQGSDMPRMVQVPSSGGDISRSHAEIRLEGWHVMLRDLFSTNGTVLVRNGQLPHRLGQGEGVIVLDGDTAELGDDVWIRFEGLA